MLTQCNVLGCRIDLYFNDYELAIEIDEKVHCERNIDYERLKSIEQELGCEFIGTDPSKEGFDIVKAINEIFIHIK